MVNIAALTTNATSGLLSEVWAQDLRPMLPDYNVKVYAAFEDLTDEQIKTEYAPPPGKDSEDDIIVAELKNAEVAPLSRDKGLPLVQKAVTQCVEDGADAVIIMCTMPFPKFESKVPVIVPYDALHWFVPAIGNGLKVGALFAFEASAAWQERTWTKHGLDMVCKCLHHSQAEPAAIAKLFENDNIDMLILDCIGYSTYHREVQKLLNIPVIHPKTLVAQLLKAMF